MTAAAQPSSFASAGGSGTVNVTTNRECQWNAAASGTWIQLGAQAAGQGEGRVAFSVAANNEPSGRRGAITIGDQQVAITQDAAPCTFTVSPLRISVASAGERRAIAVTASSAQCTWTARSDAQWLSIVEGAQSTGNGQVVFEAQPTTGPSRTGTLTVAGQTVTVTQGVGCSTSILPTSQTVGASGGSGTITVNTAEGCPWTAQSDVPWIAIVAGQTGSGPGAVSFNVEAWDGPSRTGTLRVDGHLFTVTQSAGCSYSLERTSQSIGSGGGAGSVGVRAAAECVWNASSNAPWIAVTGGATGTGDGAVQFSVSANTGAARSGTLVIAGHNFTVDQGAGCSIGINPTSRTFASSGGTGSFTVSAGGGCTWSATPSASWVRVTSGSSGSGDGTVSFSVDANTGGARTATIAVGGRTFTVEQSGGCSIGIDPSGQNFSSGGGNGSFNVTAGAGCSWSASASESWVRIAEGASGSGNGTVRFTVDAHSGSARGATISVGGRTFSIQQSAGCSYNLSASSAAFGAEGGNGSVNVDTGGGCSWSASAGDTWVRITSGAGGNGGGAVQFTVDPNPSGSSRSTTLTIAGQAFTINQSGACSYSISPSSLPFDATGGSGSFNVDTAAGCAWTATPGAGWLQVTGGGGSGAGSVSFTVAPNSGPERSGTITAGGQTFTATQASGCSVGISPTAQNFETSGGSGAISVTTEAGCGWSATVTSGAEWISITNGGSGAGGGMVQFTVAANAGAARSGTISVSGQTFTVTQGGV